MDDVRPTRFLADQSEKYSEFVQAARDYVFNLSPEGLQWLRRKPFDDLPGHKQWFDVAYTAMNIVGAMHLPARSRVLEIGAGPGWLTEMLLMLGYEVDAVEPAEEMVRIARRRCAAVKEHYDVDVTTRVRFHARPIEEIFFDPETFDGVIFYDALHHVVDDRRTLRTCFDVLKPGAVLAIVEGAWHPDAKELERALELEMKQFRTLENPFTRQYLDELLSIQGFRAITRYVSVNGYFPIEVADFSLSAAAWSPAVARNDCTARKPLKPDAREWEAKIKVQSSRLSSQLGRATYHIDFTVTNLGNQSFEAGGHRPGAINVALTRRLPGGEMVEEASNRCPLPHPLAPGKTAALSHTFEVGQSSVIDGWALELVREHIFWLADRGSLPEPVQQI